MRPNTEAPTHDGLIRIQNEISEVEKREIELRKEHATSRTNSVNEDVVEAASSPEPTPVVVSPTMIIDSKDNFKKNKIIEPHPKPHYLPAPGLTRALSTPQLFQVSPMKKFNVNSPHKGIMQKFIASRGKMIGNQPAQNNFKKNLMMSPIEFNSGNIKAFNNLNNVEKPTIERDVQGRPVRKGYIPVEEKIQSELRDLKTRECELKRLHKLNDSEDETGNSSDDLDGDWSPINGKLSKSIDALNGSSLSPSPDTHRPIPQPRNGLRPAVSLAQLCDLDESETPSSLKLIERWESIIQENQQREKSHNMH